MKITTNDGMVFEGTQAEYEAFLAFAERKLAEQEPQTTPVILQVDDVVTFEGFDGEYRKVDRKAQAGDVVIFRKNTSTSVKNGVPYLVEADCNYGDRRGLGVKGYVEVYRSFYGRTPETVDVYEKVEAEYVPQDGDIVVVTDAPAPRVAIGDIGKVANNDGTFRVVVPGKENSANWQNAEDVRKATPAEVEAYEKAVHKASFSVGDYVKIVKSFKGNEGAIAKIIDEGKFRTEGGFYSDFKIEHISGKFVGQESAATADQIVKTTADEAKWAKLGRKPGEFKKGDAARVLAHADGKKVGEIGIVEDGGVLGESGIGIRFNDGKYVGICWSNEDAELIAPVDARFDK